jgi:hypothetical protein
MGRPPAVARGLDLDLTRLQASAQDVPTRWLGEGGEAPARCDGSARHEIQESQDSALSRLCCSVAAQGCHLVPAGGGCWLWAQWRAA